MKVWLTKYCLTNGHIQVANADPTSSTGMIVVRRNGSTMYYHGEGREWHLTEASAVARAEEMKKRKIDSIKKSLKRVEGLQFNG